MKSDGLQTIAAIDVGSNSIRMVIAQISPDGNIKVLEELYKPTDIGRDTFSFGRIGIDSIHQTCETLKGFANLMHEYRIKNYRGVSTSGIREAGNREYVLEQIRVRTGLSIEIINSAQERFLIFKAMSEYMIKTPEIFSGGTLILNIGSGGIEVSVFYKGHLAFTEYLKVGSLRLREVLANLENLTLDFPTLIEEFVDSKIYQIKSRLKKMNITHFVGIGGETKIILDILKGEIWNNFIRKNDLSGLYQTIKNLTTEQIIEKYKLPADRAELLLPSLVIFNKFINLTKSEGIYTPKISLRYGVLADMLDEKYNTQRKNFFISDVVNTVWNIGKKYDIDIDHSKRVEKIALHIFDSTMKIHRLSEKERFYLQIASILHDVGQYISASKHDFHCYNIIRSENIMGLSTRELELIANIGKYHGDEIPKFSHESYKQLYYSDKLVVSKLAAILKLAESLDISHKQKIDHIDISSTVNEVYFKYSSSKDTILEEWSFINNASFFEEVLGSKPIIKRKG